MIIFAILACVTAAQATPVRAVPPADVVDTYEADVYAAFHDLNVVPPVCRLGSNIIPIPSGTGDARNVMSIVTKLPNEMLSRLYEPEDLVPIPYKYCSPEQVPGLQQDNWFEKMRADAAKAAMAMIDAARAANQILAIHSAFRPYVFQCIVFNKKMTKEFKANALLVKGIAAAEQTVVDRVNTRSALPGASEHQLGTAVDLVTDIQSPPLGFKVEPEIDTTPGFHWLKANAYRFGFVMSYPQGAVGPKEQNPRTGYVYEPWHWRYVGVKKAAAYRACEAAGYTTQDYLRSLKRDPKFTCVPRR